MALGRGFRLSFCLAGSLVLAATAAPAEDAPKPGTFSTGYSFVQTSGEELFASICQGCHMQDGMGATGAGSYPSLASNSYLQSNGYPVYVVVHGRRAMPPFGDMLTDDQIAAVVNYVRTHFGNNFRDDVTASDVKNARQ
jgi:mono/diheme cytochrome c family protein